MSAAVPPRGRASPGVPSPCINVCRMEATSGLCEGCLRTIDEIAAWGTMADDDKCAVWHRLAERRARHPALGVDGSVLMRSEEER